MQQNNLQSTYPLNSVYFYIDETVGLSSPLLLNSTFTQFTNLNDGSIVTSNKNFPFKKSENSPIFKHNFLILTNKENHHIHIHRLWWILRYTKYLKDISFIKKLKIKNLNKQNEISFEDIIEINDLINHSKQLEKEFKHAQIKESTKTL